MPPGKSFKKEDLIMWGTDIIMGSCDGTDGAINVCLGFIPRYVKVINIENASLHSIEWMPSMLGISAIDEGLALFGPDDTNMDRVALSSAGIAPYAGGDGIIYDGVTHSRWEDDDVTAASAEEKFVDGLYVLPVAGTPAYKNIGTKLLGRTPVAADHGIKFKTPAGFTISGSWVGNNDTEQIIWMAIK